MPFRYPLLVVGICALLPVLGFGCNTSSGAVVPSPIAASPTPEPPTNFVSTFDATRAFADLEKQVAFGPRVPNTEGHAKCRDWILEELKKSFGNAERQDFSVTYEGKTLKMSNLYARINPEAKKQIMFCAHWDTRPTADMEIDPAKQKKPIPGANDGASGVATLLEVARVFAAKKPDVGVQIVFFDGEDYGPGIERMFLGAKKWAKSPALPKPDYAILIDMIGDKDLTIPREEQSQMVAPLVNAKVWKAAQELKIVAFVDRVGQPVLDDHIPLQEAGWQAIDLIDFDYGPWHTLDDTPDKCSPQSLKAVGDVLAKVAYDEKP
jgi:glutaminyl-peptide cyclotransferase